MDKTNLSELFLRVQRGDKDAFTQLYHNLKQPANIDDVTLASEERMNAIIIKTDLERAIATLSCTEREILSLRANAGLGFQDIARITGQSLSAVYRSYRKTLKTLQSLLKGGTL